MKFNLGDIVHMHALCPAYNMLNTALTFGVCEEVKHMIYRIEHTGGKIVETCIEAW